MEVRGWKAIAMLSMLMSGSIFGIAYAQNSTENPLECLATNIYFEARGESLAGQIAVGNVVINRVSSDKFPNTICKVVYQGYHKGSFPLKHKCQFSWYCDGLPEVKEDKEAWEAAIEAAKIALYFPDITEGALWYHSFSVNPTWAKHFEITTTIDGHIFYK